MLTSGPIAPGVHGVLDYVLAVVLVFAPFILGFDSDTASVVSIVAGVHELQMAMLTAWSRGVVKLIAPAVHGVIDYICVLALLAAPFVFGFDDDRATAFFIVLGVGALGLIAATRFVPDEADAGDGRPRAV
ncbi:MAG: hypothetical protein H0U06_07780 [Solirubrobacterales bacterium]|nr:hypothetical protein [Solirubrobacterales bacterium]